MPKICARCLEVANDDATACVCGRRLDDDDLAPGSISEKYGESPILLSAEATEAPVARRAKVPTVAPLPRYPGAKLSMPAPLGDPLRSLRWGLIGLILISLALTALGTVGNLLQGNQAEAIKVGSIGLLSALWLYGITKLLQNRPTDILYLRSFRTDPSTGGIRTSLERALEPKFRVSGIRDPKRRWPRILRFFSYILFALKYANPRYLNLEAGNEWKGRLWRSLGEAKGVVIDFGDLTEAVKGEIRLCEKCMGLRRMLFVVRSTAGIDVWRQPILDSLDGDHSAEKVNLVAWPPDGHDRSEFEQRAVEFGDRLPEKPAGFNPDARHLAEHLPGHVYQESNNLLGVEIAVGLAIGTVATLVLNLLVELKPGYSFGGMPFFLIWYILLWVHYVSFRRNSGSRRRRRIAFWTVFFPILLTPVMALSIGLLLPSVQKVRVAAARMQSSNNLKQMGNAMHNYHDSRDHLPGANAPVTDFRGGGKKYPVSWRVELLPYLEHDNLYQQDRFDEPWDGPNNIKLLGQMPKVYLCPSDPEKVPAGYTHYRVFVSRPTTHPSAVFTDGMPGPKLYSLTDGTSNTILIVEAEEAVPWTMPEILLYDRNQPLPKLGGIFPGGGNAVMADGSVRFLRDSLPKDDLRGMISKDGGEIVGDW